MTGLGVLSFENSKLLVEEHSSHIQVPWLFIKGSIFDFLALLRTKNLFLAKSMDRDAANLLQEVLFVDGKPVFLPVPSGLIVVLPLIAAQQTLDRVGSESVMGWAQAREVVRRFMDHLYAHSIFIVEARDGAGALVQEKTRVNNLYLRLRQPAAPVAQGTASAAQSGETPK